MSELRLPLHENVLQCKRNDLYPFRGGHSDENGVFRRWKRNKVKTPLKVERLKTLCISRFRLNTVNAENRWKRKDAGRPNGTSSSRYHRHAHCSEEEVNHNTTAPAATTMSDLPVALASLMNCQPLNLDLYRILTNHMEQQRRRVNYLHQILNPPIRRRRRKGRSLWTRPGRTSQYWDNFVDGKTDGVTILSLYL